VSGTSAPRRRLTEDRHERLAAENDREHPPRERDFAERGVEGEHVGQHARREAFLGVRRGTHQHEHRDERAEEEEFVGERVEQASEIGLLLARPGELAVHVVGDGRDDEQHERREPERRGRRERQPRDERRDGDPASGDGVRQVHVVR
jgi:hypothetical protein